MPRSIALGLLAATLAYPVVALARAESVFRIRFAGDALTLPPSPIRIFLQGGKS